MVSFLKDKFSLTKEQINKIEHFNLQLEDKELEELWLDNPDLTFEDFCLWLETQDEIINRATHYDLSTMTRFDNSMTEEEIINKFMNS